MPAIVIDAAVAKALLMIDTYAKPLLLVYARLGVIVAGDCAHGQMCNSTRLCSEPAHPGSSCAVNGEQIIVILPISLAAFFMRCYAFMLMLR